jgi:hypothetical protein
LALNDVADLCYAGELAPADKFVRKMLYPVKIIQNDPLRLGLSPTQLDLDS